MLDWALKMTKKLHHPTFGALVLSYWVRILLSSVMDTFADDGVGGGL